MISGRRQVRYETMKQQIRSIIIAGGGTAGWITASALAKMLPSSISITLIESEEIGTVGVGEATIPQIRRLNGMLGLNEDDFVRSCGASFKLGIEFVGWGRPDQSYLHTFGDPGLNLANLHFHHYWLRARAEGDPSGLWDYSLHEIAARQNRFGRLDRVGSTAMTGLAYAFHFDAGLYAAYLSRYARSLGVRRHEGRICHVALDDETGFIRALQLESGERFEADLFIDCTGFRALLIAEALGVGYDDWSAWLPCNRALAVPSARQDPLVPYTRAIARPAGWQWRIPLQHRTGNGHVFCDSFMDIGQAEDILLSGLDVPDDAAPRMLRFRTGRRQAFWSRNCVSIGLASGFLEPLESTSIHLIQSNVSRLIELFPTRDFPEATIREYNRRVGREYELIRDFLILHYHLNQRDGQEFWDYCRHMTIPDSLAEKMELFASHALIRHEPDDLFRESSWVQVMLGQGLIPNAYHAMADRLTGVQLREFLSDVRRIIGRAVDSLPDHDAFIRLHCSAERA